ncbi:MAG: phage protease [Rhizobiaceae bacterium]|nr:phage protease [Rhizobiaceae bacterium]
MKTHLASTVSFHLLDAVADPVDAVTGAITFDVFAATAEADAGETGPEWIKLAPRGHFTARDGRKLEVDPELLVRRFEADGIDVPIDIDHAIPKKALFGDTAPAIAWIEELSARADGLYGRVSWLDDGIAVLKKRSHRYVSPALKPDETGKAIWLHSAGLVAAPGISMPAVASADPSHTQEPVMLKKIAQALGLTETADETACLSAIASLSQRVDKAVHDQTLQTLSATTAELNTIKAEARAKKVNDLLEGALTAKKITPAQRQHYETLCATDDGLAGVESLIASIAPGLGASGLDGRQPADQLQTLSAEDREAMADLGLTEEEYRKANGLAAA